MNVRDVFPILLTRQEPGRGPYMILGPRGRHLGYVMKQPGTPVRWRASDPSDKRIGEDVRTRDEAIDLVTSHAMAVTA